jgi:hypothetical protein
MRAAVRALARANAWACLAWKPVVRTASWPPEPESEPWLDPQADAWLPEPEAGTAGAGGARGAGARNGTGENGFDGSAAPLDVAAIVAPVLTKLSTLRRAVAADSSRLGAGGSATAPAEPVMIPGVENAARPAADVGACAGTEDGVGSGIPVDTVVSGEAPPGAGEVVTSSPTGGSTGGISGVVLGRTSSPSLVAVGAVAP